MFCFHRNVISTHRCLWRPIHTATWKASEDLQSYLRTVQVGHVLLQKKHPAQHEPKTHVDCKRSVPLSCTSSSVCDIPYNNDIPTVDLSFTSLPNITQPFTQVYVDTPVLQAVDLMALYDTGAAIVEKDGRAVGMVGERSFYQRALFHGMTSTNLESVTCGEILTTPHFVTTTDSLAYALTLMLRNSNYPFSLFFHNNITC